MTYSFQDVEIQHGFSEACRHYFVLARHKSLLFNSLMSYVPQVKIEYSPSFSSIEYDKKGLVRRIVPCVASSDLARLSYDDLVRVCGEPMSEEDMVSFSFANTTSELLKNK